ncbi:hypothetical protein GN244_ATG17120 [Phytophthora infestans]|uniref:Bzip transcription factor n=1 Tax=Phytophthora infestans TaxID=4787 RepID=A0A833WLI0_PHYIN|nr:hypothetical protein GN244_ATG17120 [Phytophthora infestans]
MHPLTKKDSRQMNTVVKTASWTSNTAEPRFHIMRHGHELITELSFSIASRLDEPSIRFSDSLIGRVLPRQARVGHQHGGIIPTRQTPNKNEAPNRPWCAPQAIGHKQHNAKATPGVLLPLVASTDVVPRQASKTPSSDTTKVTGKRKVFSYYSTAFRRQQSRKSQARYRDRQRNAQMQLVENVKQLQQEVNELQRECGNQSSRTKSNRSPWCVVAEVFSLFETSFQSPRRSTSTQEIKAQPETRHLLATLEKSFAHDAAMGDLVGVEVLLEQLQYFSQNFGAPNLQLLKIEPLAPSVMTANATLSITMTKLALRHIFPHLTKQHCRCPVSRDQHGSLYKHLLSARLDFGVTVNFLFDEESRRVVRLECKTDLATGLLKSLGNLTDVSSVLKHARITSECVIKGDHAVSDH